MSDLQCPCVVVLLATVTLSSRDGEEALRGKYLAGLIIAGAIDDEARAAATRLAGERSIPVDAIDAVDGASLRRAVNDLSDRYRGETIAVVARADVIAHALESPSRAAEPAVVAIDAAGWTMVRQP